MRFIFFYKDISIGGVQKNTIRLSRYLAEQGHDIKLCITHDHRDEFEVPSEISLVRFSNGNPVNMVYRLIREIRRFNPDIIYSAMPNYNVILVISKVLSFSRAKTIISERSHTLSEYQSAKKFLYKLSIILIPISYRLADKIIAVSAGVAQSLSEFSGISLKKIDVVHNPVVDAELRSKALMDVEHRWFDEGRAVLVSVGRLAYQKDFSTLIKAISIAYRKNENIRLIIIGEGDERENLSRLITELSLGHVIELRGFDDNPYRWIRMSGFFVLSSLWEGLPTVIIEALACGATIIATDGDSGPAQIISHDKLGFIVPVKDPQKLADAILHALENKIKPEGLLEESEKYTDEKSYKKFIEISQQLLRL